MAANDLPQDIQSQIAQQTRDLLIEGERLGRFDKVRQREFFSRYLFAPGLGGTIPAGQYEVFATLEGGVGQGYASPLTLRETNWSSAKRIADTQNLVVKSFYVSVCRAPTDPSVFPAGFNGDASIPPHPFDVSQFLSRVRVGVKYLTNYIPMGLLRDFPAPGGAYGRVASGRQQPNAVPGADESVFQGAPALFDTSGNLVLGKCSTVPAFERRFKVPLLLQHGEQFSAIIEVTEPITLLAQNTAANGDDKVRDATGCLEVRVGLWATESFVEKS